MTAPAELGLRERKRLATRRAIETAAVQLADEVGFDRVTVDEVSRLADVSPRTFFNYFPSKEAAVIGDGPRLPDDARTEVFIAAAPQNIFHGIGVLLTEATDLDAKDRELTATRRRVLRQNPQLFAMRMATMRHFEDELEVIITRRLVADGGEEGPELASSARLLTLVAFAAMRHAWSRWADDGGAIDLSSRLASSFRELEGLLA